MKEKTKIILIISGILFLGTTIGCIYFYNNPSIAVLGYHSFYDKTTESNDGNEFVMEKETFDKEMKYLADNNFKTLTLDEFYCWKSGKCNFPRKTVLITMDDGYISNYKYAFPILKKYNLNAVVFFIGSYTPTYIKDEDGCMSFEKIEKSKTEYPNIEFASHSFNMHGSQTVLNMTEEDIKKDIDFFDSIYKTKYIAYPEGKYNDVFINALKEKEYKLGFGFGPVHKKATRKDDDFVIPRLSISDSMPMWKFKLRIVLPY